MGLRAIAAYGIMSPETLYIKIHKKMQESQNELVAKLKDAQNVLVTVSHDPSVDQLSAAIGLTVALNNLNKHASAVFSGQVPSTMEFLQPEETLEKNTDSLRDFIIALDKSKADKLRYKVEDSVVRIFITPYKTSISQDDLEFSQGDFNVDVVVALGVQAQQDLDDAIQAHGRILHDAVVATVTLDGQSDLGTLHVSGNGSTSLSELVTDMLTQLDKKVIDTQAATALLTGIVAVTERFSNSSTTPKTMSISSALMAAGANQQLIASELEAEPEPLEETTLPLVEDEFDADIHIDETGTLAISHDKDDERVVDEAEANRNSAVENDFAPPLPDLEPQPEPGPQVAVDTNGNLTGVTSQAYPNIRGRVIEPPSHGGTLTANTEEEPLDKGTEELTLPGQNNMPMMSHDNQVAPLEQDAPDQPVMTQEPTATIPTQEQPLVFEASQPPQPALPAEPDLFLANPTLAPVGPTSPTTVNTVATEPPLPAFVPESAMDENPDTQVAMPQSNSAPVAPVVEPEPMVKTLEDLERELGVTHEEGASEGAYSPLPSEPAQDAAPQQTPQQIQESDAEAARKAVEAALLGTQAVSPDPIVALNAQPLGGDLHTDEVPSVDPVAVDLPAEAPVLVPDPTYERPESPSSFPGVVPESHQEDEGEAAPPVPPPFVPPTA